MLMLPPINEKSCGSSRDDNLSTDAFNASSLVLCRQNILGSDEQGRFYTVLELAPSVDTKDDTASSEVDRNVNYLSNVRRTSDAGHAAGMTQQGENMDYQDRHIDTRLTGIEGKLDAKVDGVRDAVSRMQKGFDDAERRFERANSKHDTEIALARQQVHQEFKEAREAMSNESVANRRHATTVAWATVAGVFAGFAIVITVAGYWISEQGSYAKSYGETQVEMQRAADERADFREAFRAIQVTQQSILERLPPPSSE
ncbi:hypothetical protein [Vreelandella populi]|uniref:Uncharacterized protein n=1 Tax=Vreelandella populi TaxID=2498858 RepID=A0A433LFQ6_9GAMM|nr:hypothetical protein [Halomonas populi]RUR48829.1 hypothetical protein ELY37_02975 [Halomonas populi]